MATVDDPFKQLKRIQGMALKAICADDDLMERLVLKGGTAVDLMHGIGDRSSIDLDFSMDGDFTAEEKGELRQRLERLLEAAFRTDGLVVFDVTFEAKPKTISADMETFWGGYRLEFKLIEAKTADRLERNLERMQRQALRVGPSQRSKFEVEISRHEHCADKERKLIDGFTIYVYSPRLIVCEKLRAICQQMPEYRAIVKSRPGSPRARDFFDISNVVEKFSLDVASREFFDVLVAVFAVKRVPIGLLDKIPDVRAFHEADFASVKETVTAGTKVREFEAYFAFVVRLVDGLKAFRNVESPAP
jgi:hypothetical protein